MVLVLDSLNKQTLTLTSSPWHLLNSMHEPQPILIIYKIRLWQWGGRQYSERRYSEHGYSEYCGFCWKLRFQGGSHPDTMQHLRIQFVKTNGGGPPNYGVKQVQTCVFVLHAIRGRTSLKFVSSLAAFGIATSTRDSVHACRLVSSVGLLFSERELMFMFTICRHPSVCLSVVCNVRAPYSGDWNFRQCFYAIWYLGHLWPFGKNFTEIVPGEPFRRRVKPKRGRKM